MNRSADSEAFIISFIIIIINNSISNNIIVIYNSIDLLYLLLFIVHY